MGGPRYLGQVWVELPLFAPQGERRVPLHGTGGSNPPVSFLTCVIYGCHFMLSISSKGHPWIGLLLDWGLMAQNPWGSPQKWILVLRLRVILPFVLVVHLYLVQ